MTSATIEALWPALWAKDDRITDPIVRAVGLGIAAGAFWPGRYSRIETRNIARRFNVSEADVLRTVDHIAALGFGRRQADNARDGRPVVAFRLPDRRSPASQRYASARAVPTTSSIERTPDDRERQQ